MAPSSTHAVARSQTPAARVPSSARAAGTPTAVPVPLDSHVYISGPMSGLPELNHPAFDAMAELLDDLGYGRVFNPADVTAQSSWEAFMRVDIAALVDCHVIVMLPDWQASRGARLEHHIARELGLTVIDAHVVQAHHAALVGAS